MKDISPLVPCKCDLTSFPYLPIEVEKFLTSREWIAFNHVEKVAFINLLLKSWHEVPSASLPADDLLLMHFAGIGRKWSKVKEKVLSEWVLASDSRYYHPYVAKKALEAWLVKLNASLDASKGNEKRWNLKIDSSETLIDLEEALQCLKVINPTSKSLENHVLKAMIRSQKRVDEFERLSGGDPNINQINQNKKILKGKDCINDQWARDDDFNRFLEVKRN